jgi:hypothetical protein
MKTKCLFTVLFFALSFLWLTSCKDTKNQANTSIEFDTISVQKQIPLINVSDTTLPFADYEINFVYPSKFGNDANLVKLQRIFINEVFGDSIDSALSVLDAVNQYQANYTNEYQSLSKYFEDDRKKMDGNIPVWYWYSLNLKNVINFISDSLLSFSVEYSDYTGGAHGSFNIKHVNVDLIKVDTISEQDIFVTDYKPVLTNKIVNRLMEKYGVSTPDSLVDAGLIFPEGIVPNNNFWLDNDSIHYSYNQYEIAPYYLGVIDVAIPITDLKEILLPDGFLKRYIKNK